MRLSQADHQRIDRLAGDGNDVVGIDLATLFRVILNQVQDNPAGVQDGDLAQPVRDAVSNHARVERLYGSNGADPWASLIVDALGQLEVAGLAVRDEAGAWMLGPGFATGKRLIVVPGRKGKHKSVGVKLYPADERETLGEAEKQRMEITSMAASMREDGRGLRPVNPKHVEELAQSMRDYGYRREFPVLMDGEGRILDGRHRLAAARMAGVAETMPPPTKVDVRSDAEALGFAILVNLQRGWTDAERRKLDKDLQAAGLSVANFGQVMGTAAKRELIKTALLENPELTHNAIAKRLGYKDGTGNKRVGDVCAELIRHCLISECGHRLTEDGKQAPGPKPQGAAPFRVLTDEVQDAITVAERAGEVKRWQDVGERWNLTLGTAQRALNVAREQNRALAAHPGQSADGTAGHSDAERADVPMAPQPPMVNPDPEPPPAPAPAPPSEQAARAVEQMINIALSIPPGERAWVIARLLGDLPQHG